VEHSFKTLAQSQVFSDHSDGADLSQSGLDPQSGSLPKFNGSVIVHCSKAHLWQNCQEDPPSPRPTQPSILPGAVNEYQLLPGRQRQVWFNPLADVRGVCK